MITLLTRPGCHLCEAARTIVARIAADVGEPWEERDITRDQNDLAEYHDHIPVTLVDGKQIDFWTVDEERLRSALRSR